MVWQTEVVWNNCRAHSQAFISGSNRENFIVFMNGPLSNIYDLVTALDDILSINQRIAPHQQIREFLILVVNLIKILLALSDILKNRDHPDWQPMPR
ncbi:hypothetical protein [Endozoicomonas sp. 4G]|uniref:hypothetical protein n=1 Tax=Endozoicomonas sp. 4G TaxID=2872754 RepID=UPI0020788CA2|nr:hypothetical protein [Endozoicomonas sp. 4G]